MSQLSSISNSWGFTLIEMLVTMGVMVVVLGGGIVGFIRFNERQTVLEASKQIQTLVRSARVKAQVKDTPEGCSDLGGLQGFRVSGTSGAGSTINVSAWCGANKASAQPLPTASSSYTLPSTISLDTDLTLTFYTLHGGTDLASEVDVAVSGSNLTYHFFITPGGELQEGCWGTDRC